MAEKYLGYVTDKIPSNDESKGASAIIKVVAIKENGVYRKLSNDEAKKYCPPNGKIFGPQFYISYNSDFYDSTFIEFEISHGQEKEKKVINQTDFIINYIPHPKTINLPRLVTYNGKVKEIISRGYLSPNEVNTTVDKANVFGGKSTKFFLYDSVEQKGIGTFKYQNNSDVIESNYGKDVQEFTIPSNSVVTDREGRSYLLFNEMQNTLERGSIIDFMTNQQLADWLKNKMKDAISIDKNTLTLICNLPESQSAEDDREASRFERLKDKAEAFDLNVQTLIELICTHPKYFNQFIDNIEIIEKEVKDNFEKKFLSEASGEIKKNQEILNKQQEEISKLDETLKSEKEKITAKLEKEIEEKSTRLQKINENYDTIIATISAIAPVLNFPSKETSTKESISDVCSVEFPKDDTARPYSKIKQEDDESFISFMKRHVCFENDKLYEYFKQVKKIFSHKACFIPNTAVAYLFAKALRNTEVKILHVEHDWLHYSDFVKQGLLDIFKEANRKSDKNYILVFDGLNLTQPECGLRPLLNLINEEVPILEGCDFSFPKNMTVMATLISTNEENSIGLKLSPSYYEKWYAIGDPSEESDKIKLPNNFWEDEVDSDIGYTEPTDLPKEQIDEKSEGLEKYLNF